MKIIFFLRGLNTYGDTYFRIGPFKFGLAHDPLKKSLEKKSIEVVPLLTMGVGSIDEMCERARKEISQYLDLNLKNLKSEQPFINILAHSTGGLVARQLIHDPFLSNKIDSLITIGSPHYGVPFVDQINNFSSKHFIIKKILDLFGYKLENRKKYIEQLNTKSISNFNEVYYNLRSIRYAHILCFENHKNLSLPFQIPYKITHTTDTFSDGLVSVESQKWGESLGTFKLDHASQLGYFLYISPKKRQEKRDEFLKMVSCISNFFNQSL